MLVLYFGQRSGSQAAINSRTILTSRYRLARGIGVFAISFVLSDVNRFDLIRFFLLAK